MFFLLLVNMFDVITHLLYVYGEKHFVCLMQINYLYCIVLFSVIPANDTKESMVGHQNVSSPAVGIEPDNLAAETSMCANH